MSIKLDSIESVEWLFIHDREGNLVGKLRAEQITQEYYEISQALPRARVTARREAIENALEFRRDIFSGKSHAQTPHTGPRKGKELIQNK